MDKKQQTKLTYAEITEKINSLQFTDKSKSKDFITLTNTFCKLKEVKTITVNEIEILLANSIIKTNEDYWKFLLEVFSRFFYKSSVTKGKTVDKILSVLYGAIEKKFDANLDKNALTQAIIANDKPDYIKSLISNLEKVSGLQHNEYVALVFMLFLLAADKLLMYDKDIGIRNLEKYIFELYGVRDKSDKFYIKSIAKSIADNKADTFFYSFVGLYEGTTLQISELENTNRRLEALIGNRNEEILLLNSTLKQRCAEIETLNQQIQSNHSEIQSLQKDLEAGNNQNEFNENLYKKQYESLKKGFIEKLKKELRLEIQGLEDLADILPDSSKSRIQRRIDNIYKILQKAGE